MVRIIVVGLFVSFLVQKLNPSPVGSSSQGQLLGHSRQVCRRRVSPGSSLVVRGQALGSEQQGWPLTSHLSFHSAQSRRAVISTGFCIHWITCHKQKYQFEFISYKTEFQDYDTLMARKGPDVGKGMLDFVEDLS